jgi:hypothetical protein
VTGAVHTPGAPLFTFDREPTAQSDVQKGDWITDVTYESVGFLGQPTVATETLTIAHERHRMQRQVTGSGSEGRAGRDGQSAGDQAGDREQSGPAERAGSSRMEARQCVGPSRATRHRVSPCSASSATLRRLRGCWCYW